MPTALMPSVKSVTHEDDKFRPVRQIVEVAYDKARLSEKEAQRLNENGGELKRLLTEFIEANRASDRFKDEEVSSSYVYPKGYKIKAVTDQVATLIKLFPGLDITETLAFIKHELPKLALPRGAEGWFAIPRWDKIGTTYNEALDVVLTKIGKSRSDFKNYREGETGPTYLRQTEHSAAAWEKLGAMQKGDILVIPLQLGLRHRGCSPRRAREVIVDSQNEFALGAFAVGCVTLTHPERFQRHDELDIDCSGDDYAPDGGGGFSRSLRFYVLGGGFGFCWGYLGNACGRFGSASGFLPQ